MNQAQNIYVIDDEVEMRDLLRDFLAARGYHPVPFSSAIGALEKLRTGGHPALVVSDVRMSPMDGMQFLEIVRREFPDVPVILVTAAKDQDEAIRAKRMGAVSYLNKPFSLHSLEQSIQKVFRKK